LSSPKRSPHYFFFYQKTVRKMENEKVEKRLQWRVQESLEGVWLVGMKLGESGDIKAREDMILSGIALSIARVLTDLPLLRGQHELET
jgi:hypothetical protein